MLGEDILTEDQIQEFLSEGVLVVDGILSEEEVNEGLTGFSQSLARHGIDVDDLESTGRFLQSLSSTNGSGGVLDIFYEPWKMKIASHPKLFRATSQLWRNAFCHKGESLDNLPKDQQFKWHPYGAFDFIRGFMYIDRVGYRLPTILSEKLGQELGGGETTRRKSKGLQRSLTPHLDCCPEEFFSDKKSKWRPIQCFVSLTCNTEPNTGGFEAAPGFHRDFSDWATSRQPTRYTKKVNNEVRETLVPAPCIGEYTHIRPKEDADIMKRFRHIPVRAGSVVFFDNRIPHASAYRNDSDQARAVIYCSFLPDVPMNRRYAERQLLLYKRRIKPDDQWINLSESKATEEPEGSNPLSELARKLLLLEEWE